MNEGCDLICMMLVPPIIKYNLHLSCPNDRSTKSNEDGGKVDRSSIEVEVLRYLESVRERCQDHGQSGSYGYHYGGCQPAGECKNSINNAIPDNRTFSIF